MKKISIIGLTTLLAACSSGSYTTDVTSESYKEDFKPQVVASTVPSNEAMTETSMTQPKPQAKPNTTMLVAPEESTVRAQAKPQSKKVKIVAAEQKHRDKVQRFGYTLQVIAVDSAQKAQTLANQLPSGTSVWEHYKRVNGTDWYALLYGDYETKSEAKAAISTLPVYFRELKPFVKSLDDVKNSEYPKLKKLK
ncbi:SPOR domain-containing protein [Vibrio hannami]|uniref:SPOR domain-containing protein n=1 Tax=Vibrio hannami TaxID=2717094 RepID=UPI00240EC356|nr:SPOR domain-containing protein [Vibrio hannami]MDG3085459.1 SPOR domain-containing protein [Vibrio hannami]